MDKNKQMFNKIPEPPLLDYSIYRTPTGSYYCKTCNITLSTELMFVQHLGSKKHSKNVKISMELISIIDK